MDRFSLGCLFVAALATAGPQPSRLEQDSAIRALKQEFEKQAADHHLSGAMLVAKAGKPIFEQACGYSDIEHKITNTIDTKFRFASMAKMFTAVAILQLVQNEKVQLSAPLIRYLPDYPNKAVGEVTIEQLLTHTGGTGEIFTPEFDEHRKDIKTLDDYVKLYGARDLEFPPASKWKYSNYGYVLLGRVIEAVSGKSYYDYVRDNIFVPAGMSSTGNEPENTHVSNLAIGYTRMEAPKRLPIGPDPTSSRHSGPDSASGPPPQGELHPFIDELPYRGTSAGGGYSTVHDLLRFAEALNTNKLLNAQFTDMLTTGKIDTPRPGIKYAFGFEDHNTSDGVRFFGHGGGAPGMNGRLSIFPKSHYVVAVLSNFDPPAADNLAHFIEDRLPAN